MPKVSFRMASAYREWVFGVQTNTARKIHRSDHTEGRLTTAPSGCCVRKGTVTGTRRASHSVDGCRATGQMWHLPNAETVTTRRFVEMVFAQVGRPGFD